MQTLHQGRVKVKCIYKPLWSLPAKTIYRLTNEFPFQFHNENYRNAAYKLQRGKPVKKIKISEFRTEQAMYRPCYRSKIRAAVGLTEMLVLTRRITYKILHTR